jgi:hypothetical protein
MIDLREIPIFTSDDGGPFTDEMVRHYLTVVKTQHGITKYAEAMAQVLAAAAIASHKSVGDYPLDALDKWLKVIKTRARELIQQDMNQAQKKLEAPTIDD